MVCRMNIDHALRNALEKEAERVRVMKKREHRRRHSRRREEKAEQGRPPRNPFAVPLRGRGHPVEVVKTHYSREEGKKIIDRYLEEE